MKIITYLVVFCSTTAFAQVDPMTIPLWENGAPGFENRKDEPELAEDYWVKNIHNPSITAYHPPAGKANGTAVLICPGGGHRLLVINAEGRDAALYFNELGVTAFVLKYRLGREEGSPYNFQGHPRQDANRAIRMIRSRAKEWNINPEKIGIMGFSAGGEVASMVSYESGDGESNAVDPTNRLNGRPNFQVLIYPGPYGIPDEIPAGSPPVFMLVANDDRGSSGPVVKLINGYREANIPLEAHIYSKGGHAFNMGYRTELKTLASWPQRLTDWLTDNEYLD
ncbi:MAG: alpha/beta hydrolase [Bacteroidetes bacterium]|nr:alpha/beta hydrolase [Bacteroidota bacterium]MDA1122143.1 alpha/beta hydrolase [Bacteroidota bacterium]